VAAQGTLILSGSALDVVEGSIAGRIAWRSSRDGAIGSGPYLRLAGLGAGSHTITAAATNAWGTEASAAVEVEVLAQPTYAFGADIYSGILLPRCVSCHHPAAADWPRHHLDLRTHAGIVAGGDVRAYESVAPCRPESSLVWNKVTAQTPWVGAPMPPAPNPRLPAALIEKLRVWISEGAPP
jgi:hypothetical protein